MFRGFTATWDVRESKGIRITRSATSLLKERAYSSNVWLRQDALSSESILTPYFAVVPIRNNYSGFSGTAERCPATICQRSARLTNTTVILSSGRF